MTFFCQKILNKSFSYSYSLLSSPLKILLNLRKPFAVFLLRCFKWLVKFVLTLLKTHFSEPENYVKRFKFIVRHNQSIISFSHLCWRFMKYVYLAFWTHIHLSVTISCGETSSENITIFSDENIPTGMGECNAKICPINNDICQVRIIDNSSHCLKRYS